MWVRFSWAASFLPDTCPIHKQTKLRIQNSRRVLSVAMRREPSGTMVVVWDDFGVDFCQINRPISACRFWPQSAKSGSYGSDWVKVRVIQQGQSTRQLLLRRRQLRLRFPHPPRLWQPFQRGDQSKRLQFSFSPLGFLTRARPRDQPVVL